MEKNDRISVQSDGAYETGEKSIPSADAGQEETSETLSASDEFEQLIRGKYAGEFARRTQRIIDKRFKETKALEAENARFKEFMGKLTEAVGHEIRDPDELFEAARAIIGKKALSGEEIAGMVSEARSRYPGFDLPEAQKNGDFQRYAALGLSYADAYTLSHIEEIKKEAAKEGALEAVRSIGTMRTRPPETSGEIRTVLKKSASELSPREIRSYAERAAGGERISFDELGLK